MPSTTILLGAITAVAVATIFGVTLVAVFAEKAGAAATMIIGVTGTTLTVLVNLLRSEFDRHAARDDRLAIVGKVDEARETTQRVEQKADLAAVRAAVVADKVDEVKAEVQNGVLAVTRDNNEKLSELKAGAVSVDVIETVAKQVREATKEQAVEQLLNCPHLRALLEEVATLGGEKGALAALGRQQPR